MFFLQAKHIATGSPGGGGVGLSTVHFFFKFLFLEI